MPFPQFKNLIASAHILVILGLLVVMCLPLTWPVELPVEFWIKQGIDFMLYVCIFYLNLFFLVPKLLFKAREGVFAAALFFSALLMVYLNNLLENALNLPYLISKIVAAHHAENAYQKVPIAEFGLVIITLIIYGISTIIAVAQKIQTDNLREQQLEKQKVFAELSFLKTQINPHFFFNVLHTIYALIDQNVSLAKDSVYTLSHMMRYVLYETGNDITSLEKEIKFIEDYIKLMNLRIGKNVQVIFDKPLFFNNIELAPMLFLPYIENAYKHGINLNRPSYIYIEIRQKDDAVELEVKNSLFTENADHLEQSNGIGLINTQRRLDLLYAKKYDLEILRDENRFEYSVKLKLNLI